MDAAARAAALHAAGAPPAAGAALSMSHALAAASVSHAPLPSAFSISVAAALNSAAALAASMSSPASSASASSASPAAFSSSPAASTASAAHLRPHPPLSAGPLDSGLGAGSTQSSNLKRNRSNDQPLGRSTKPKPNGDDHYLSLSLNPMDPPVLSFYGTEPVPLPSRFGNVKRRLIKGREEAVQASWARLLKALRAEVQHIAEHGSELIPSIDFADIDKTDKVAPFRDSLKRHGIGVIRRVVPQEQASAWVEETSKYLETKHDFKPPAAQDPTCFDFFWTPAQVRSRAHPNVLQAQRFAMGLWDTSDDDNLATRFPITYADRLRIESIVDGKLVVNGSAISITKTPEDNLIAAAAATSSAQIAQVDNGSLERWEMDGYGRAGLYDAIFKGEWEEYNPWDPAGRINATPDLYNGAGACSMLRLFQGILALTVVEPGMIRLLPSPKLSTVYFLLRPFFSPTKGAPEESGATEEQWDEYLAPENWKLDEEQSTIIHGAVAGHAQRVTGAWHPHLQLDKSLVTPPTLQVGDYIVWHPDQAYQFSNTNYRENTLPTPPEGAVEGTKGSSENNSTSMLVYTPAAPLTQTNALFLARQRKAFLRGHPGPDFDSTGTGLGSEAPHTGRLGEKDIREVGGEEALQAMGLAPWNLGKSIVIPTRNRIPSPPSSSGSGSGEGTGRRASEGKDSENEETKTPSPRSLTPTTHAEVEVLKMANTILWPDRYEFYMPTRASSPVPAKEKEK
ncbi:uncharacterized protein B0I36DRAFT_309515 [Microdochium trichocladiopsis]|uniref:Uncharacterized protein n=1 Tax=Microdochium trichocladiopsis TaxID=1682393 RepID=A0A9P8YH28_9PEZI|nr:uncharacterized protein B0I36DRAFT_309515 [Microdochium trichocladiopsis]KAH7039863.1 hypothetical protein B0I36DRAFT_309515 [Microdochium trichocladiopsis]